eukprot:COSAG03_NODE_24889_length_269_cov_0.611765_1_plen_32_part_01
MRNTGLFIERCNALIEKVSTMYSFDFDVDAQR